MISKEKCLLFGGQFLVIFVVGFILTFPFPYNVIPDLGSLLSKWFIPINELWIKLFNLANATPFVLSDSTGLYVHLITLCAIAILATVMWRFIVKRNSGTTLPMWFHTSVSYYLALTLMTYGFNKVFKWQFFFPEPNTLYTDIGQMTPDILYWSAMGSSYAYSFFSGLIEIIPACLLLFKKTRLLGGAIALMVLLNVAMINFGFDISVKVYALFLVLLAVLVIIPNLKSLYNYFSGKQLDRQKLYHFKIDTSPKLLLYSAGKPLIIGILFLEVLWPYFETQNFNDDLYRRPYLHGAYTVNSFQTNGINLPVPKRIFVHRRGYFIFQYSDSKYDSYPITYSHSMDSLKLKADDTVYSFKINQQSDSLHLSGYFKTSEIRLKTTRIDLSKLPISANNFYWTIDNH